MPNIYSKSQYEKSPSGMVLKSPQLTISIKLIAENIEDAIKSVIDQSQPQHFI